MDNTPLPTQPHTYTAQSLLWPPIAFRLFFYFSFCPFFRQRQQQPLVVATIIAKHLSYHIISYHKRVSARRHHFPSYIQCGYSLQAFGLCHVSVNQSLNQSSPCVGVGVCEPLSSFDRATSLARLHVLFSWVCLIPLVFLLLCSSSLLMYTCISYLAPIIFITASFLSFLPYIYSLFPLRDLVLLKSLFKMPVVFC